MNLARRRRININTLILSDLTSHRELFCISVSNVVNIFIFVAYCIYMKITTKKIFEMEHKLILEVTSMSL